MHAELRAALPGLGEFIDVLLARGRLPEVHFVGERRVHGADPEEALVRGTRWLWMRDGSAKQARLQAKLRARGGVDGSLDMGWARTRIGRVTWPGDAAAMDG